MYLFITSSILLHCWRSIHLFFDQCLYGAHTGLLCQEFANETERSISNKNPQFSNKFNCRTMIRFFSVFAFFYYFYSAHPRSHFTALWYHFTFGRLFAISSRMVLTECGHVMPNSQWIQTNENAERTNWIKSEPCWICKKKQIH